MNVIKHLFQVSGKRDVVLASAGELTNAVDAIEGATLLLALEYLGGHELGLLLVGNVLAVADLLGVLERLLGTDLLHFEELLALPHAHLGQIAQLILVAALLEEEVLLGYVRVDDEHGKAEQCDHRLPTAHTT